MLTFTIPDDWEAKIKEWQETHECKFRVPGFGRYVGSVGGADTFSFTPTSVGMCLTVKCACGAEISFCDW